MWIVWLEKKILQTLGILLSILAILLVSTHYYLVNNAEKLIETLVQEKSENKLKLTVRNIKFSYFSRNIELQDVSFYSNDTLDLNTTYRFDVPSIHLKVKKLIPIFTKKELMIDSLYLTAPKITVTRIKAKPASGNKDVSIPEEMGRIYNSIIDALGLLHVNRFEFNNGQFTLINKIEPDQLPLTITNLHFYINNLKIDTTFQQNRFLMSDQMEFRSRNQDILFPDGNHRLAFSRFRINIRNKLIEIDSCTLSGQGTADGGSKFNVFLDTLKLVNVDFEALYQIEMIKADSVFLKNPRFKIELAENTSASRKEIPNLDTIIQQFTGDLLLHYIGVSNASVDLTTYNKGNPSTFKSDNNNFEMEGLSIDGNSPTPVILNGFSMAIRNYENYLKDSSHVVRFDSILLRENRILLSNFSVNSIPYRDNRNINVQRFVLSGMSWSDLLFNQRLKAQQATLINPVIDHKEPVHARRRKNKNLTGSLSALNNFMELQQLQIINGQLRIQSEALTELSLTNANALLTVGQLLKKVGTTPIENSVEELSFDKGFMKLKNLVVEMEDAAYTGSRNNLALSKMKIRDMEQSLLVRASGVVLDSVLFDEETNFISAGRVTWENGIVELNLVDQPQKDPKNALQFDINRINGKNTVLDFNKPELSVRSFFNRLKADRISKITKPVFDNLQFEGANLVLNTSYSSLTCDSFRVSDKTDATFNTIQFLNVKNSNRLELNLPAMTLIPDINSIIDKKAEIRNLRLHRPAVYSELKNTETKTASYRKPFPVLKIDSIRIDQPKLNMNHSGKVNWNGDQNQLLLTGFSTEADAIRLGQLNGNFNHFSLTNKKGTMISSGTGSVHGLFENIMLQKGDSISWEAFLKEATAADFSGDSLGQKQARWKIDKAKIQSLKLNNTITRNLPTLLEFNHNLSLTGISGFIFDLKNQWQWNNLSYFSDQKKASIDSFSYRPVQDQDAFIAASPWQTDYMTFHSGKIEITGVDPARILRDSIYQVGNLNISQPYFTSYRDKRPPFKEGIIKPLPSAALRNMKQKISIDTIYIHHGNAIYTEFNEKTMDSGIVNLTRISGDIFPVKTFDLKASDSLRIRLNFYLLDSAWVRLRTRESYLDSLSGFIFTLRMRPGSLSYLNKILEPLALVRVQSGYLDTLTMRAIAKDDLSLGEMRMYYHDLRVQFLRNSDESKKRFLNGLMTFIANSFVIKNKNTRRAGVVYFPRLRDRSFLNYYTKIALSGIASSIGAKKNKRLLRRYQKQLKTKQLPKFEID